MIAKAAFGLALIFLLSACGLSGPTQTGVSPARAETATLLPASPTPSASPTARPSATRTPTPRVQTMTQPPSPTARSTATPQPTLDLTALPLPTLPGLPGQASDYVLARPDAQTFPT